MITHLEAVEARLQAVLGVNCPPIVIADATGHSRPYLVLNATPGIRERDIAIAGTMGNFRTYMDVTAAASTARQAIRLAQQAAEALTPGLDPSDLPGVAGRHVTLQHIDSRDVEVDRTVTDTQSNTHPAWVLVRFTLHSQPA